MDDSLTTIRRQLAASPPHVSMKIAVRTLIQALRRMSRDEGAARHPLASRAAMERCLGATVTVPEADLVGIKSSLKALVQGGVNGQGRALEVADRLWACVPHPLQATEPCRIQLNNLPPQFTEAGVRALLGCAPGEVTAAQAALARHRVGGLAVGGSILELEVTLPVGRTLPPVPRDQRVDRGRWGREAPWLTHLDETGRRSLTPRALGERTARKAPPFVGKVVDACCGCGGNAVAFARRGLSVVAVELDPGRARMARMNASENGLAERVRVIEGSIEAHLQSLLQRGDLLFVDPPWVGEAGNRATTFGELFDVLPLLARAVASFPVVVLKLPRTFAVETLPGGAAAWDLFYEVGAEETGDGHVVRMIRAQRPVCGV